MKDSFGLNELEVLAREMKVTSHDAHTIAIICKVTGMTNTIVLDIRNAVRNLKAKVGYCTANISKLKANDKEDNLKTKAEIKTRKIARNFVRLETNRVVKVNEASKKTITREQRHLQRLMEMFG